MYTDIIDYISEIFLKHKAVKTVKYQNKTLINSQNNNAYVEVSIENNGAYAQLIKTNNVFTLTLNINVLAFPKDETDVLEKQNVCFQIANEVLAYIERDITYKGMIYIYDYDYLSLSHFSDDNSCGWRMSLELVIPIPIDLCTLDDNFSDEIEIVEPDDIDLPQRENKSDELVLTPIKLPKNKK